MVCCFYFVRFNIFGIRGFICLSGFGFYRFCSLFCLYMFVLGVLVYNKEVLVSVGVGKVFFEEVMFFLD